MARRTLTELQPLNSPLATIKVYGSVKEAKRLMRNIQHLTGKYQHLILYTNEENLERKRRI